MTIITAAAAKAISDDVLSNECSKFIAKTMEEVLKASSRGENYVYVLKPRSWGYGCERSKKVQALLENLGYEVVVNPSIIGVKW